MSHAKTESASARRALAITLLIAAAFGLFFAFTPGRGPGFWGGLASCVTGSAVVCLAMFPTLGRRLARDLRGRRLVAEIGIGLVSAVPLYGIFALGNRLSRRFTGFAGTDIDRVYAFGQGMPVVWIALLIALVIGPGEEVVWRGFVQEHALASGRTRHRVLAAAALYAAVHVGTGNLMLVAAAGVCGLYWGALFAWKRSLPVNIVSHVAWDLAVFVLFPFS